MHISCVDCNLDGCGCAKFQILSGFSEFHLKSSIIYLIEDLHISFINHSKYSGDRYKPRMAWERSISGFVAEFQTSGV